MAIHLPADTIMHIVGQWQSDSLFEKPAHKKFLMVVVATGLNTTQHVYNNAPPGFLGRLKSFASFKKGIHKETGYVIVMPGMTPERDHFQTMKNKALRME